MINTIVPTVVQMDFVRHHSFFAMDTLPLNPHLVHRCNGEVVHLILLVQRCMAADTVHTVVGGGIGSLVGMTVGPVPGTGKGCCSVLYILLLQSLL